MAEDGHARPARRVLARLEQPAGLDAEPPHLEQIRGRLRQLDVAGIAVAGQRAAAELVGGQRREALQARAPFEEVRQR